MPQPAPQVTQADVERIVRREFRPEDHAAALDVLAAYGTKSWHNEPARVRVALLKLARGNLQKLRQQLAAAGTDYRDVLSMAEYPSYFTQVSPGGRDPAARQQAIDADWRQYRRWFEQP